MFDPAKLKPEQRTAYEQLVAALKAAKTAEARCAARWAATEEGPGDLLYVRGAMASAEIEAGTPEATSRLVREALLPELPRTPQIPEIHGGPASW